MCWLIGLMDGWVMLGAFIGSLVDDAQITD